MTRPSDRAIAQALLTGDQVREIYSSPMGCRRLARIYGVDAKAIKRIRNGTQWEFETRNLRAALAGD
jgi:hypothetical protein